MLAYPFSSVLEIMKPCKVDRKKPSHVERLEDAMNSAQYGFEEKIDGISITTISGRMFTNKLAVDTNLPGEKTSHVPHLSIPLAEAMGKMIFDGELYYPYKKSNHVTSITNADVPKAVSRQYSAFIHQPGDSDILPAFVANRRNEKFTIGLLRYVVYDILRDIDGTWLITKPFIERRRILEERFNNLQHIPELDLNAIHYDNFQQRLDYILSIGGEGAVLKDLQGLYMPGKRPMWNQIKVKQEMEDDVVITGFEEANRVYSGKNLESWPYWENDVPVTENHYRGLIGSISIGKYNEEGVLTTYGSVTGLTDELRKDMTLNQHKYLGTVIKIKAMEKSEHGVYRHANFMSLHPDKNPKECKVNEND